MRAQWELQDQTRVEASIVDIGKWSVRVNGIEVPSTSTKHSFFSNDTTFSVSPGREATLSMRKQRYGAEIDLHVDGQVLLYPGRKPFRCPTCRSATHSHQRTCSSCSAQLPTRAARVQELRARSLFQQMALPSGLVLMLGCWSIPTLRDPQAAMARLGTVQTGWSEAQLRDYVVSRAEGALVAALVFAAVIFGLAVLSRRLPMTATALNFLLWLGWCASWVSAIGTFNLFGLGFQLVFIWSAYRCLRLGAETRAANRELQHHEALRGPV